MLYQLMRSSADIRTLAVAAVATIVAFVVGIGFHEFCHVWAAYSLGDPTGRNMGRLTLNPLRHLDPLGSMLLLLVGFGWGKPAPVNPNRLRTGPTTGFALVALAGPASNFVIAALFAVLLKFGPLRDSILLAPPVSQWGVSDFVANVLRYCILINVLLGVFNLVPIPPLDGYRVLLRLLPTDLAASYQRIEQYGPVILMVLLFALPFFTGVNPINDLIGPVMSGVQRVLLGG
ncbi:MAG: site-2 protease family protein [Dehalococcoidia bacterium]